MSPLALVGRRKGDLEVIACTVNNGKLTNSMWRVRCLNCGSTRVVKYHAVQHGGKCKSCTVNKHWWRVGKHE